MANRSVSNELWDKIKTHFITSTSDLVKGNGHSMRNLASKFGVNVSALIRKADTLDENNKTWWELRENFKDKYGDVRKKEIAEIKERAILSGKMLANLKKIGYKQLSDRIKKGTYKISARDYLEILKMEKAIDQEVLPMLISTEIAVNLKIDKPIDEMDEVELKQLSERIDRFSKGDIEEGVFEVETK